MVAKCREVALNVQCMPRLAEGARCLSARVVKLEESPMTEEPMVGATRRTADIERRAEQACTEHAKRTTWFAQLKGDVHDFMGRLEVSESCKNVADSRYYLVSKFDSQRRQISGGNVLSGVMIQKLANECKDVDALIGDLNCHAEYGQKEI